MRGNVSGFTLFGLYLLDFLIYQIISISGANETLLFNFSSEHHCIKSTSNFVNSRSTNAEGGFTK